MENTEPQASEKKAEKKRPTVPDYNPKRVAHFIVTRAGNKIKRLADKLDVTEQTIRNWKTGKQRPDPDQLMILADLLFCNVTDFYGPFDPQKFQGPSASVNNCKGKSGKKFQPSENFTRRLK